MEIKLKSYVSKKLCQVAVKQNKQEKKIICFRVIGGNYVMNVYIRKVNKNLRTTI